MSTLSSPSSGSPRPPVLLSSSLSSVIANGLQRDWNPRRKAPSAASTPLAPPARANRPSRRHSPVNNSAGVGGGVSRAGSSAGLAFSNKINQVAGINAPNLLIQSPGSVL